MSIKSKIQALITAANTTTGESDTTLTDAVQTLCDGYGQGGGTTITDGIVVKAKNSNGYPTEVDVYGDVTPAMFAFTSNGYNQHSGWEYLQTINLKTPGCKLYKDCFSWLINLTTINGAENVIEIYGDTNHGSFCETNSMVEYNFPNAEFPEQGIGRRVFCYCNTLKRIFLPKASGAFGGGYFIIQNCTALESVQMGSVGYTITNIGLYAFQNCTQSGLTITIYTVGDNADRIVTAIRYYATSATIIIKASETTEYNGVSYAAGDTILTSEVSA